MGNKFAYIGIILIMIAYSNQSYSFILNIRATNGFVIKNPDKSSYAAGDTVLLFSRPNSGYFFSGWSGDIKSKIPISRIKVNSNMEIIAHFDIWTPPLGIPKPTFGINEINTMYSNKDFNFGSSVKSYKDAGFGPYTHYVDKSHSKATDLNNPYGTEVKPRKSIPTNIPPGSVVEIHNSLHSFNLHGLKGSSDKPIFIRGANRQNHFVVNAPGDYYNIINCQYIIIENALFKGPMQHGDKPIICFGQSNSHCSIRHCEIDGCNGPPGIYFWTQKGTYVYGQQKENIVLYDNDIHNCGNYPQTPNSNMSHGIMIDNTTQNIWIVDNRIYENGADGIQILDRSRGTDELKKAPVADRIFFGRNMIYNNSESAVDAKGSTNVIFSQNELFGSRKATALDANGDALRINDEGYQNNIWILFNRIHDSDIGIGAYGAEFPPYVIGNIFYNLNEAITYGTADIVENVFFKCDKGINANDGKKTVANNILALIKNEPIKGGANVRNNLLWRNGEDVENCLSCWVGNPLFADTSTYDFNLLKGSPAIDRGNADAIETLCTKYKQLYGIDIRFDCANNSRPVGSGWDVGPYEH
jgi:hypothetical protein